MMETVGPDCVSDKRLPLPGMVLLAGQMLCARTAVRGCHGCFGGFEASQLTNNFAFTLQATCFF